MFELNQHEPARRSGPLAAPANVLPPAPPISHNALLVWGEHCIECAAPACYSTCDLYEPRPDGRCRRLQFGAVVNSQFPTQRGYGVEITFRKWGKLEARGNTRMLPAARTLSLERWVAAGARAVDVVGRIAATLTGSRRWRWSSHTVMEKLGRRLHVGRGKTPVVPDAFLLEVYNPGAAPVRLQISFNMALEWRRAHPEVAVAPSFQATLYLPTGYSRHEVEYAIIRRVVESGHFDISLTPESDSNAHLVILSADLVRFRPQALSDSRPAVKCVVWDLDNTLWDGVLLEGGGVSLKPEILAVLHFLDQRGVLLSVASKNDYNATWPHLVELGIDHLFLYPQINWLPKSDSIKRLAARLSLNLDTFAFVDDNPFELGEVSAALPQVECVPVGSALSIPGNPRFQGSTSNESAVRRKLYQEAVLREEEERQFGDDYVAFLRRCEICLTITAYQPAEFDRASELVQRTNQLNFSGRKYSRQDLLQIIGDPARRKYVLRCKDRYGDYGVVGFAIVVLDGDTVCVEDFMLSCRVQGKFIEQAFFAHIAADAERIWVNYAETAKNQPARKVLETLGFKSAPGGQGVELVQRGHSLECDFIRVDCVGAS